MNIDKMRAVCQIASSLINDLKSYLKPGLNGLEINDYCHNYLIERGAWPAPLNYHGFPKSICLSINEIVCHGIPNSSMIIKDGDIVSIDISCSKDGHFADNCYTYIIGNPKFPIDKKLVDAAYDSMFQAISAIKPGVSVGTLGYIMENTAKKHGFYVVKDFCGHGIGTQLHQDPQIPFFGRMNTGEILQEGMCITIEPMIVQRSSKIQILADQWTTKSLYNSAQFEKTILVTKDGYEILTDWIYS